MKTFTVLLILLGAVLFAQTARGQAQPTAAATPAAPSLITDKMEQPAVASDAVKLKVETNPVTKRLTVRTNIAGPVRVEVNDSDGRPVITRDLIAGDEATVLDVSKLPTGYYIVQCTAGERRGVRRVMLGQ